jgi:hypothetical protein
MEQESSTDEYLTVEEVARRLDLPLRVLVHRVEAGDVPARREEGPNGPVYRLRMRDLGMSRQAPVAEDSGGEAVSIVGRPAAPPTDVRPSDPRHELAAMDIDSRGLVAGLLDRWERTLEQRIYAEQRMRFEAELSARQNLVRQLQLELQSSRAEQSAALAERDRRLAEHERRGAELQRLLEKAHEAAARRRGWPWRR